MSFMKSRSFTYGSTTILSTVVFIAILAFVALIAQKNPLRWDLSEAKQFTLTDKSLNVLKSLQQPVTITAFYAAAAPDRMTARDLLDTYALASKKVAWQFVDPDAEPEKAKRLDIKNYGTIAIEGYGKKQLVQSPDEETITNAIFKLTRGDEKKVYFLTGHGERAVGDVGKDGFSMVRGLLEKESYKTADLNLVQTAAIPKDAAALVIVGPKKALLPVEIASLAEYVGRGGKLLVTLNPNEDGGLREFLKTYGIELADDVVIDKLSRAFGGSYLMPVVTQYGDHKITAGFTVMTFYPEARSVRMAKEPPKGVTLVGLAATSDAAWAETNLELLKKGEAGLDEGVDMKGPVTLAVAADIDLAEWKGAAGGKPAEPKKDEPKKEDGKKDEAKKDAAPDAASAPKRADIVVFGDTEFADNAHFGLQGNGDLFANTVNFLAEEETLISIEPRQKKGSGPMLLTRAQGWTVALVGLVALPLVVLFAGITVYRVRRSRR